MRVIANNIDECAKVAEQVFEARSEKIGAEQVFEARSEKIVAEQSPEARNEKRVVEENNVNIVEFEERFQKQVEELVLPIQTQEFGVKITREEQPDLMDIKGTFQRGDGNFWVVLRDCDETSGAEKRRESVSPTKRESVSATVRESVSATERESVSATERATVGRADCSVASQANEPEPRTRVVGTIGVVDIGNNQVALKKMFVHADARGKASGVAQALMDTAKNWCRERGVESIILGTTARMLAAHRFYEKNGFVEQQMEQLPPNFPVVHVDTKFYRCDL
ncbi:GNAT family N-acetyltransferase [Parvibaculum sp.]|uniref:GNAT family N-acetyltransferase n=1 Tax=Parvibaculum sp. TaxID=2024848 RepID=UPI003BAD5F4F